MGHGKDVNGAAAEKLQSGELAPSEVEEYKKGLQEDNVQAMKQACGKMTAMGKANCRLGCGDKWGEAAEKRSECDDKCVEDFSKFETSCVGKTADLEKIYKMKLKAAGARKQCYDGFCASFPTVWSQENTAAMADELNARCAAQCTDESIEISCRKKWQLEVDFKKSSITQQCFDQGGTKACFDEKK